MWIDQFDCLRVRNLEITNILYSANIIVIGRCCNINNHFGKILITFSVKNSIHTPERGSTHHFPIWSSNNYNNVCYYDIIFLLSLKIHYYYCLSFLTTWSRTAHTLFTPIRFQVFLSLQMKTHTHLSLWLPAGVSIWLLNIAIYMYSVVDILVKIPHRTPWNNLFKIIYIYQCMRILLIINQLRKCCFFSSSSAKETEISN